MRRISVIINFGLDVGGAGVDVTLLVDVDVVVVVDVPVDDEDAAAVGSASIPFDDEAAVPVSDCVSLCLPNAAAAVTVIFLTKLKLLPSSPMSTVISSTVNQLVFFSLMPICYNFDTLTTNDTLI